MSDTKHPQYTNIFKLITEIYADKTLSALLYDTPEFQDAYQSLPADASLNETISHLITFAEDKHQLDFLLSILKMKDEAIYERHQPYFGDDRTKRPVDSAPPTKMSTEAQTQEPQPTGSISVGNIDAKESAVAIGHGASANTTTFDQRGQQVVGQQINISGEANFNHPTSEDNLQAGLPNKPFWVWMLAIGAIIVVVGGIVSIINDSLNIGSRIAPAPTATVIPATFTPKPTSTIIPTATATPDYLTVWETCIEDNFSDVQTGFRTYIDRYEWEGNETTIAISSDNLDSQDSIGPFMLELYSMTWPIGGIKFSYSPANDSFKILSSYDGLCQAANFTSADPNSENLPSFKNGSILTFTLFDDDLETIYFGKQEADLHFIYIQDANE